MINTNYQIKVISAALPMAALNIGKVKGHESYVLADMPHVFILNAFGKYYTIEYKGFGLPEKQPLWYDELSAFVESIKYLIVWELDF